MALRLMCLGFHHHPRINLSLAPEVGSFPFAELTCVRRICRPTIVANESLNNLWIAGIANAHTESRVC